MLNITSANLCVSNDGFTIVLCKEYDDHIHEENISFYVLAGVFIAMLCCGVYVSKKAQPSTPTDAIEHKNNIGRNFA